MTERGWWRRGRALLADAGGPWGGGRGSGGGNGGGGGDGSGGGGGPRNPWSKPPGGGKPRGPRGSSAVDQFSQQLRDRLGGGLPGGRPSGKMIRFAVIAFVLLWLFFTSFHRVEPNQQGVITRFGKYAGKLEPGIGMTFPSPIDRVQKIDVQEIKNVDIPQGSAENLILTGDQNLIDLAYSVRWQVRFPEFFLFQMARPEETITEVAESAMREVMSTVTLSDAFGPQRSQIETRVADRMQALLNDYKAGITIRGVAIKQADPPASTVDAFKSVTAAQQAKQANINNANAYASQIVQRAQGEATAFDKVYAQYKLAPEVTRRRMYYETMEEVLANSEKTIVEPGGIAPYLPLGRNRSGVTVEEAPR